MINIDPRQMKQLLQLSAIKPLDAHKSAGSSTSQNNEFDKLLMELLTIHTAERAAASNGTAYSNAASAAGLGANAVHNGNWQSFAPGASYTGDIQALIREKAARYQVDPALVTAVIQTESSFNPNAVSSAGAKGLMQLMDGTAAGLGVKDSFDPEQNVDGGVRYLSMLLDKYNGNVETALAAYNAGPGRIDRLGIRNDEELRSRYALLPIETQGYVNKVKSAYSHYEANF